MLSMKTHHLPNFRHSSKCGCGCVRSALRHIMSAEQVTGAVQSIAMAEQSEEKISTGVWLCSVLRSEVLGAPRLIYNNIEHLSNLLGFKFVTTCIIIYGLQQGLANSWFFQARDYYFKDHLMLEPAVAQTYSALSMIPWSMKPLYGMASDFIPVFGYHRIPYICFAGFLSTLTMTLLCFLPLDAKVAVILLFFANLSVATPDVMIDGIIAEKTKDHPKHSTDLQSLLWGSLSLFAIGGYLTSGYLISTLGSKNVFGLATFVGVLIFISGASNWVGEVRRPYVPLMIDSSHGKSSDCTGAPPSDGRFDVDRISSVSNIKVFCGCIHIDVEFLEKYKSLLFLSAFLSVMALLLGALVLLIDSFEARVTAVAVIAMLVISSVLYTTRNEYSIIGKTALFLFSVQAMSPDIDTAMFYWYTNYEGGPQFTPRFIGYVSAFSFAAMFLGILAFNRYLGDWQFRNIFYVFLTMAAALVIPDLMLINRWNLQIGVPDELLVFGEATIAPIIRRCLVMPMFIIAAKVCPPGAEATVFAMLTALSNFGAAVSSYFGATLLVVFNIQGGNYDNLMWLLIVKKCCRLTTLLLVHALVPPGCPNDTGEIKNPADDGLWGADNGFSESNRHNFGNLCGVGASTHGLLDSSHGKGVDNSTHSNDSSFSDATAKNPIFLQAKVPLEYVETAVEMKSLTPSLAVGLDDKMVVKSKESPSRLIRYIPPHDNMTTQNV